MDQSDQDSGSNRNHLARRFDFSVPATTDRREESSPPPSCSEDKNQSGVNSLKPPPRSPVKSSSRRSATEVSSQDVTPPTQKPPPRSPAKSSSRRSSTEVRSQDVTPPTQKPPVHREKEPLTPRGETKGESKDGTPSKQRHCKCKASRCLKLYCECFASGSYCNGCNCLNCHNTLEKEASRQEAIKVTLERNPDAFKPKIAGSPRGLNDLQEEVRQLLVLGKHSKGCHCKRSGCLKKYCECYQADVRCSDNCRCQDCKNFEGSEELQQRINAAVEPAIDMSCYLHPPESTKINSASHYVGARGSSAVNYVIRNGDTSLFTVPNNKAVSECTTSTYRSSLSNTIQLRHVKELCSLLVSKSVDVANNFSDAKCETENRRKDEKDSSVDPAQRDANVINDSPDCVLDAVKMDEKPLSPATRALMCDDEHVNISETETSARGRTSQEKEDKDTSSEVYLEQERQILSSFRDHLIQLLNRGSIIAGTSMQKNNTNPSRKEPEDEEQNHRGSSFGA